MEYEVKIVLKLKDKNTDWILETLQKQLWETEEVVSYSIKEKDRAKYNKGVPEDGEEA